MKIQYKPKILLHSCVLCHKIKLLYRTTCTFSTSPLFSPPAGKFCSTCRRCSPAASWIYFPSQISNPRGAARSNLVFCFYFFNPAVHKHALVQLRNLPRRPSHLVTTPTIPQRRVLTAATASLLCATGSGWA